MLNWFQFDNDKAGTSIINYGRMKNHAVVIYSPEFAKEKLEYLHNNPVRAGLVRKPEDYIYSSATNYAEMESVLEVILLDLKWETYF